MAIFRRTINRLRAYWGQVVAKPAQPYFKNADTGNNKGRSVVLSFSLSRIQRVVNPGERLMGVTTGTCISAGGLLALIQSPWTWPWWLFASFSWIFTYKVFGGTIRSFYGSLVGKDYINTIEIAEESIAFGVNELTVRTPRKPLKVSKGLLGTYVIHHPYGYAIVVSRKAIPFEELKARISA